MDKTLKVKNVYSNILQNRGKVNSIAMQDFGNKNHNSHLALIAQQPTSKKTMR